MKARIVDCNNSVVTRLDNYFIFISIKTLASIKTTRAITCSFERKNYQVLGLELFKNKIRLKIMFKHTQKKLETIAL